MVSWKNDAVFQQNDMSSRESDTISWENGLLFWENDPVFQKYDMILLKPDAGFLSESSESGVRNRFSWKLRFVSPLPLKPFPFSITFANPVPRG